MRQIPSWKWLASPFVRRSGATPERPGQPCLPRVEQLDDRILLDATASETGGGTTDALIGLLSKAQVLSTSEFLAIDGIKGESQDDKHKDELFQLGDTFVKIDEILAKFSDDVLGGTVGQTETSDVMIKLNDAFVKIDVLATDIGGGGDSNNLLLPAVQKIHDAALGSDNADGSHTPGLFDFVAGLSGSPLLGGVSADDLQKVMKIGDGFIKLDGIVMKVVEDVVSEKVGPDNFTDAISDVFVKLDGLIGSISDTQLKTDLQTFETQFQGGINAILNPGDGSVFTGGVVVAGATLT